MDDKNSEGLKKAYEIEISRFQSIIDAINNSQDNKITLNGYTCLKRKDGTYVLGQGNDEYFLGSMVRIGHQKTSEGTLEKIEYSGTGLVSYLGRIEMSDKKSRYVSSLRPFDEMGEDYSGTVIENAMHLNHRSEEVDRDRQKSVKQQLYMLSALGIELTPDEKMHMLKCKKEDLETELAQVNEQLKEQESQQK